MWLEETTSPSTSTSRTTRVWKRGSASSISVSPAAPWPKRKFSPTETWVASSAPTRTCSMNSEGVCAANCSSNGITTSSRTPSAAISSILASRLVSSRGAASGRITVSGCGSNVSTVSLPPITSRWPRCTPSNSPTATRRGRGATSFSIVTCIAASLFSESRRWASAPRRRRPAGPARSVRPRPPAAPRRPRPRPHRP